MTTEVPLFTQVDLTDRIDLVGNPPLSLPRYDEVCRAVRELKTFDEVDEIIGRAEAIRAYAKQARNRQLELDAAEIRIRAERRLGELMLGAGRSIGKATGARGIGTSAGYERTRTPDAAPTLAEAGIDKHLAHRARSLAAVPEKKFEELLRDKRRRKDRRAVLDRDLRTEADAVPDITIARRRRISPGVDSALAAENEALSRQVADLRQRVAALLRENRALENRVRELEARGDSAVGEAPAGA